MSTDRDIREKQGEDKHYVVPNVRLDSSGNYNDLRSYDNNPFIGVECTSDQRNYAYVDKYIGKIGRVGPKGKRGTIGAVGVRKP